MKFDCGHVGQDVRIQSEKTEMIPTPRTDALQSALSQMFDEAIDPREEAKRATDIARSLECELTVAEEALRRIPSAIKDVKLEDCNFIPTLHKTIETLWAETHRMSEIAAVALARIAEIKERYKYAK